VVAAAAAVLGVGVGFAFAAVANLVLAAVEPRQSGEAAGINTIMRTVGGAIGAQTAATVVAGAGYTGAFVMSGVAMAVAALVALTYPREAA
jgi:predicted MFS family arabinose efflux permease